MRMQVNQQRTSHAKMLTITNLHVKLADEDREIIRGAGRQRDCPRRAATAPGGVHSLCPNGDSPWH